MIEVKEHEGYKFVRKDGLTQSIVPSLPNGYWKQMVPDYFLAENALVLGLGAGTVCYELLERFGHIDIDVVDNDPEMVKIAKRQFFIDNAVDRIFRRDAFEFVKTCEDKYSIIIVDLFDGFNFSLRVITDEFLNACKGLLKEGGVLSVNIPNLDQCKRHFDEVKSSEFSKIYFYHKDSLIH